VAPLNPVRAGLRLVHRRVPSDPMAILGIGLSEQGSSTRFSADIVSRRCHLNKEKTKETALCRATGHRRFRGSDWFGTDRRGRRNRAAEPGQCPNHCYPRPRRATGRPTAAAIRRGYGRAAVPPLTTTARLGRGPSNPAVRAMGLGRRASRDADEDRRSTRHRAREGDRRASPICRRRTRRT
jgi:hypothetical protein